MSLCDAGAKIFQKKKITPVSEINIRTLVFEKLFFLKSKVAFVKTKVDKKHRKVSPRHIFGFPMWISHFGTMFLPFKKTLVLVGWCWVFRDGPGVLEMVWYWVVLGLSRLPWMVLGLYR